MSIQAYLHCKTCRQNGTLEVGLSNPETLVVRCTNCNQDVGTFGLSTPMPIKCDVCGEGGSHTH